MGNKHEKSAKAAESTRDLTDKEIEMVLHITDLSKNDILNWYKQFLVYLFITYLICKLIQFGFGRKTKITVLLCFVI